VARKVPVLIYHSVCDDPAPRLAEWTVSPATFRDQMAYLSGDGWNSLTVSDYAAHLLDRRPLPERAAVVTFDDGFADFAEHAAPILTEHGVAATLYVSTAYVGGTSSWLGPDGEQPMLAWSDIEDVAALGVEVGAHGHEHVPLDELTAAAAQANIIESKSRLEHALGLPVASFAYPHGYHSRAIKEMVRLAGFSSACAVKQGLSGPGDDVLALGRFFVPADASVDRLKTLMTSLSRAPRHERLQTKAWRTWRRAKARRAPRSAVPATKA
jgi:peptidoglycan/xylan/chitin deacetylase (PgdA/CDA1 family)